MTFKITLTTLHIFFLKKVVEAMRQTVTNMMGTLPPQFFAVTVSTVLRTSNSHGCLPNGKFTFYMTLRLLIVAILYV